MLNELLIYDQWKRKNNEVPNSNDFMVFFGRLKEEFRPFLPIIIIIIIRIFQSALDDGPSLKFEWQQVSSSLQGPSNILADLKGNVVFEVLILPLILSSSSQFQSF